MANINGNTGGKLPAATNTLPLTHTSHRVADYEHVNGFNARTSFLRNKTNILVIYNLEISPWLKHKWVYKLSVTECKCVIATNEGNYSNGL